MLVELLGRGVLVRELCSMVSFLVFFCMLSELLLLMIVMFVELYLWYLRWVSFVRRMFWLGCGFMYLMILYMGIRVRWDFCELFVYLFWLDG